MIPKDSFITFQELGITDYILFPSMLFFGQTYPLHKYSAGDLLNSNKELDYKEPYKVFKDLLSYDLTVKDTPKEIQEVENQTRSDIQMKSETINEEVIQVDNLQNITNIESFIENKLNESNSYTENHLEEIQKSLTFLNNQNSFITNSSLFNLEQKLISITEDSHNELSEIIIENKKHFEKFLNS